MIRFSTRAPKFLKMGVVLFCFMCLFFAINTASKYEHQKTETEIQTNKVKDLKEKIHELSSTNQELVQIRYNLVQEKEQMAKEIKTLREKCLEFEDWKHAIEKGGDSKSNNLTTNQQK